MLTRRILIAFAALSWAGFAVAADVPGPAAPPGPADVMGVCADSRVLRRIQSRFAWAERHTWHRGYVMDTLLDPRPSGHPYYEPGLIGRDYCMADAIMTNGEVRRVYYAIEHGLGFAGIGRNVDFCVLGLDPWHIHDAACRTVR